MPFDSDEPPTKKLGRSTASSSQRETFDLALRRVRERCRRVQDLCQQTVERESRPRERASSAPGEHRIGEQQAYLRALEERLYGRAAPETEPAAAHVHVAPEEQDVDPMWHHLFDEGGSESTGTQTPAARFELLRHALEEVLGPAATATLIRRAAGRAARRAPELDSLSVPRDGVQHRYRVPDSWRQPSDHPIEALRELVRELSPLVIELTGMTVIRHLSVAAERSAARLPSPRERRDDDTERMRSSRPSSALE